MKYIKAKFLKEEKPYGRAYTFRTEECHSGDIAVNEKGTKLIVIDEDVDMEWVESYGVDKIGVLKKYVEEEVNGK